MIDSCTLRTAAEIWSDATRGIKDGKLEQSSAIKRVCWIAAGVAGAATFVASFGFLAMPLIAGWTWFGGGLAFIAAQYSAQILLDLPEYWTKAAAYVWLAVHLGKRDVKERLTETRQFWDPNYSPG